MSEKYIDMDMTDAILEKPIGFSVGKKRYYLYPASLGVRMMTSRIIDALNIQFTDNAHEDIRKVIREHKDDILRLIAHYTFNTKEEHFDEPLIEERINDFRSLTEDDIAVLLYSVILDDVERFKEHIGLNKDIEEQQRVMKIKERKNTITFGGKSIYGTIIDSACERYGWTMQYVVWGISYTNLCMLLADSTKDVYLTDDEMKKYQSSDNTNTISADDIGNMNLILSRSWE